MQGSGFLIATLILEIKIPANESWALVSASPDLNPGPTTCHAALEKSLEPEFLVFLLQVQKPIHLLPVYIFLTS